jgi:serine/threonine protein kinase
VSKRAGVALLIGIDHYRHADQIPPLRFAAQDAEAMAAALADPDVCNFPPDQVLLLTGEDAQRDAVVRRLSKWLPEKAKGTDLVVIYFAGHGMVQRVGLRDEGFLLPHDAEPDDLVTRGVAMSDVDRWITGLDCGAVVVCLDCCHAGKLIARPGDSVRGPTRDLEFRPDVLQGMAGKGRFLLASCDEGQKSVESPTLQHGLFTYHLLEGMRGAADRDGNGKVGVAELFEYVAEAVERDAREQFGRVQRPWHNSAGPGGVYISAPMTPARPPTGLPAIERLWHKEGAAAAVRAIEHQLAGADEAALIAMLRMLERNEEPAGIPAIFRCLVHPSEAVRRSATRAVQAIGWDKTAAAIEGLAKRAGEDHLGVILEGLAAFEAHPTLVALLDRLVLALKGSLRNRAILLLERKRVGLERDQLSALFVEKQSPYRIQKVLGQGLFTAAYLARHELTGLEVVVRVLRPEFVNQPHVRAQFLDLSSRSMSFVHQNLVVTRDVMAFPDRNVYYTVRDHVDGVTLQKLLESGKKFEPPQVVKVLRQLLEALTPLHRQGAFHGGIKPSNIFLCGDDRVILGDLSLPVQGTGVAFDRLSYDYRYAPPEMFRGGGTLGPPSDFYALGCVSYELLCGEPPFVSDNYFELATKHDREAVRPPSRRGSAAGAPGDAFIQRLLAKSAADRFRDLEEALGSLEDLRQELLAPSDRRRPRMPAGDQAPQESAPLLHEASLIKYDTRQSIVPFGGPETTSAEVGQSPPQADSGPPPDKIGGYEILEMLGRGGMGVVYKARQVALNRLVALKMILGAEYAGPEALTRFRTEAEAVARLQHPNIVQIYEIGEQQGLVYFSLEYVEGGSLAGKLSGHPLPPAEAARMAELLARAVHYAHQRGILHRDLKPANVLLTAEGVPKITDFGLAKRVERESNLTQTGVVMGTPSYMSPEQAEGRNQAIGPWTDVYALGATLYDMLTGRPPFRAESPLLTLDQLRSRDPVPPSRLRPDVPRDLEAICLKCLHKEPGKRYASAEALADDLRRFLASEPIAALPSGVWRRMAKWVRRRWPSV